MNVLPDPGFELGLPQVIFGPQASRRSNLPAHSGSWMGLLGYGQIGQPAGAVTWDLVAVTPGVIHTVSVWCWAQPVNVSRLRGSWRDGLVGSFATIFDVDGASASGAYRSNTLGTIVPTQPSIALRFQPVNTPATIGEWWIDDAALDVPEPSVPAVAKWTAHQKLLERLRAINGSPGGYWHNLESRVYPVWASPAERAELTLPFMVVPLLGEETTYALEGRHVRRDWTWVVWAFLAEQASNDLETSQVEAVTKLEDDLVRALSSDYTLGGSVLSLDIGVPTSIAGLRPGGHDYGEVRFPLRLTQVFQRSQLGPGGI